MGWAIVAHFDGRTVEAHGSRLVTQHQFNTHELMAFVEAMLFAQSHGFAFEEMVFFTDDDQTAYGGTCLYPENGRGAAAAKLRDKVAAVCDAFHDHNAYKDALECLTRSRFQRVIAHECTVDHNRVDYLSRTRMNQLIGKGDGIPKPFDEWLAQGFRFRRQADDPWTWYAPFSAPAAEELAAA